MTRSEKIKMAIVFGGLIINGVFDVIGVGSVIPFLAVVGDPTIIQRNAALHWVYQFLGVQKETDFVLLLGLTVMGFLVFTSALRAVIFYSTARFTLHRHLGLSSRLFQHYVAQAYPFFLTRNSSDLIKRFSEDIPVAISNVLDPFLDSVSKLFVVLGLIVLVLLANPIMALFVVVVIGGAYLLLFLFLKKPLSRMGKEANELNRKRMRIIVETFSGIKENKFFGLEHKLAQSFHESARNEFNNNVTRDVLGTLPKFFMEAVAFGGIVGIVLFLILSGKPVGALLPLLGLYAFAGYRLLPYFQQIFSNVSRMRYSFVRLDEVVRAFREGEARTLSETPEKETGCLELRQELTVSHLNFSYASSSKSVLNDVNFTVPVKSIVGIVGGSGEGKSTLVDILLGLLPVEGTPLSLDGLPLDQRNLAAWRATVGYVPQTIFLADTTIAENIAFGLQWEEIDWNRMDLAVERANLTSLIQSGLAKGYKTELGERGVRLSGGQRQRVGIARALYRNPSTIILDEATSSLDVDSETLVMDAIQKLGGHLTVIVVAHRLSTLQACDQIYQLKGGRIELVGTYQDLMLKKSLEANAKT
ncbi:MAG: ABC transporter ATP-binding protein [Spirochaetales bacterium]|nr:ABC transporter ATP-binding protein [Spirochaetales bacterium]